MGVRDRLGGGGDVWNYELVMVKRVLDCIKFYVCLFSLFSFFLQDSLFSLDLLFQSGTINITQDVPVKEMREKD